jgi:hypothetical protein
MPPTKKIKHTRRNLGGKKRGRKPIPREYSAALWTTPMAVAWSGLKHHYILDLIQSGKVPSVLLGPDRVDTLPNGKTRRRSCAKYLLLSAPFKEFVEGLGLVGKLKRSA